MDRYQLLLKTYVFDFKFYMTLFCHKSMHNHHKSEPKSQLMEKTNKDQYEEFRLDILIVGRIIEDRETFVVVQNIIRKVEEQAIGVFYFLDTQTANQVKKKHKESSVFEFQQETHSKKLSFVITIGGDGTILYAAKEFNNEEETPPFLVFQKGTLGFMCQFSLDHLQMTIQKAIRTHKQHLSQKQMLFKKIKMMRLGAELQNSDYQTIVKKICVNQVAITRQNNQKIILEIYLNKQLLTETQGDGLLISTPTGSTAYALSAGGPIISNGVNCIQIVPIAPYSLSFRPLCLPSSCQIKIEISQKSKSDALISFDGQSKYKLGKGDSLMIKKSTSDIVFYEPLNEEEQGLPEWIERLQLFLRWNEGFKPAQCKYNLEGVKKITNRVQSYGVPTTLSKTRSFFESGKKKGFKSDIDTF